MLFSKCQEDTITVLSEFSVFPVNFVQVKWSKVQKRVRNIDQGTSLVDENLQDIKMEFLPLFHTSSSTH